MSKYIDKILNGQSPIATEWEEHLIESHRKSPGMTPAAYADCRNAEDLNSYEWLVNSFTDSEAKVAVDLACGDGFLIPLLQKRLPKTAKIIGIDMSEAELEIARQRSLGTNVTLRRSMAHTTGLSDGSVDAVFCHMAFMLMLPIEPVVSEMLRILKTSGTFAAIISDRSKTPQLFSKIQQTVTAFLNREFPHMAKPLTGDPRVQSESGLRELLAGFHKVSIWEDSFSAHLSPLGVWDHIKNMYIMGSLPVEHSARLKALLISLFEEELSKTGHVVLDFPLRKLVAIKG